MTWEYYYETEAQATTEVIVFIISTLILLFFLVTLLGAQNKEEFKSVLLHDSLLKLTFCVTLGAFLYNILFLTRRVGVLYFDMHPLCGLDDFWVGFLAMSRISQYILFLTRLHYLLKNTVFGYSYKFLRNIGIGVVSTASFLCILYITIREVATINEGEFFGHYCAFNVPASIAVFYSYIGFDTIMNIFLMCLYLRKYFSLQKDYLTMDKDATVDERTCQLTGKLSVLVTLAQISTWIAFLTVFANVHVAFVGFDLAVNSGCVLLCLQYYQQTYLKLCGKCENFCQSVCKRLVNQNDANNAL